jgi:vancomycin resistance protein VanW
LPVFPEKLCLLPDRRFTETMIRRILPPKIKLQLRLAQRYFSDKKERIVFARTSSDNSALHAIQFSVDQQIKRSYLFENKVHNLHRASKQIEQVVIRPGEVFSFWNVIGNPSEKNGYKKGRNIVNGKLQEAVGGGLCQLSGIIYHTVLLSGLTIIERHNHTIDIYKEEDRFTPLGADATVVYGYKDLRFRNSFSFPISFRFVFGEEAIRCSISGEETITARDIDFIRREEKSARHVETIDRGTMEVIVVSIYKLP